MGVEIFALLVALSFAIETHGNIELNSDGSLEIQNNATDEVNDLKDSQIVYLIRTITTQPEGNHRAENDDSNMTTKTLKADDFNVIEEDSDEKEDDVEIERTDAKEHSGHIESETDLRAENDDNNVRRKFIVDSLFNILSRNHHINKGNGDIVPGVIDNPRYNDNDQNLAANTKVVSDYTGKYGTSIDMKGRSGIIGDGLIINRGPLHFLTPTRRTGFMNPGFYQYASPPAISFSKIDSRDLLTMSSLNNLRYRRLELPDVNVQRLELPLEADERSVEDLALDTNAYRYEPVQSARATQIGYTAGYRRYK